MSIRTLHILVTLILSTTSILFDGHDALARATNEQEDDLILYYSFDTDQGREVADLSGNGNHGKIRSASYVAKGRIGRAIQFNGEGDYIDLGDTTSIKTEEFTFAAWVKTNNMKGQWQSILSFEAFSYTISILPNGHIHYGWQGVKPGLEGTTDVRSGQWVFVTVARDADNRAYIYVNGDLEKSIVCDYYSKFLYSGKIGGEATGTEYFHGSIDEVRLYKQALSEEEVRNLYTQVDMNPALTKDNGRGQADVVRIDQERVKISGIVRDKQGKPPSDVHIVLRPKSSDEFLTDSTGRFSAHYLMKNGPRSASHVFVFARHPGRNLAAAVPLSIGESHSVEIKLHDAVTIQGRICNYDRQPIPNSKITVILCDDRWGQYIKPDWFGLKDAVTVEDNGVFRIRTLPHNCFYELVFHSAGQGKKRIELGTWNERQHTIDLKDVALFRANQRVTGWVKDDSGRPVPDTTVSVSSPEQPSIENVKTNEEGKFSIQGLAPGKITLQASIEDESQTLNLFGEVNATVGGPPVLITVDKWIPKCGIPGPGPWSLQGKPLPPLPDLNLRFDTAKSKDKKILLCFWRKDRQNSRHFMRKLIHMTPELEKRGFYILALQVAISNDDLVSESLMDLRIPFVNSELTDSETCLKVWGFPAGWLPWVIITDENHTVTNENFGLQILRHLQ